MGHGQAGVGLKTGVAHMQAALFGKVQQECGGAGALRIATRAQRQSRLRIEHDQQEILDDQHPASLAQIRRCPFAADAANAGGESAQ